MKVAASEKVKKTAFNTGSDKGQTDVSSFLTDIRQEGGDPLMSKYITGISSVEIPVSNLDVSVEWYTKHLGLAVQHRGDSFAMLTFDTVGVPGVYLCKTESGERLTFINTYTGVIHSVIDFYTADLEGFYNYLVEQGVETGPLNISSGYGGFGFKDPDGNLISACNVIQRGQK